MITETGEDTAPETTKYPAVKYDIPGAVVAELREKYEGLTIQGPTDKGGLALVHTGRMECKGIRVAIEKRRKGYNAGALDFIRVVNSKAAEATAPALLLEKSLKAEEDRIKAEIAEIKAAKQKEEEDRLQRRVDLLLRFGKQLSIVNLKAMSDDEFQTVYDETKVEHEAEEARLAKEAEEKAAQEEIECKEKEAKEEAERLEREAKEEEDRKEREAKDEADRIEREAKEEEDRKALEAEEARLAEERADLDRVAKEQEEKEEELRLDKERIDKEQAEKEAENKAENDRLEAERVDFENDKKIEEAKKEAAAQATKEAEDKAKREVKEKEEADRKAKEEEARQETLRPDKERLETYAQMLVDLPGPELKTEDGQEVLAKAEDQILTVVATLRIGIKTM